MQHESANPQAQIKPHEARAWLLARLQLGQELAADAAFLQALLAVRDDRSDAPTLKILWQALADACLERGGVQGQWEPALAALAATSPAPRLALLLRLLGRLEEVPAALVLGISQERYRQLLGEAAPKRPDGRIDEAAWHALSDQLQAALTQLSPRQTVRIAGMRTHAWQPQNVPLPAGMTAIPAADSPRSGIPRRWRWAALPLFTLALAALGWWGWTQRWLREDPWQPQIRVEALPPAAAPAGRFEAEAAVLAHPDFALASTAVDPALLQDIDLLAWYADKIATPPPPAVIQALPELPESAISEQTDASSL